MRLSTLPRISATRRSGRAARSWAARRGLPVPTTAPAGSAPRVKPSRETRTSRTSARSLTAATVSPSVEPEGMSFKLCTATSIWPPRRARSSSTTNTPRPPISASDACDRSPLVVTVRSWKRASGWARRRASRASSVCRRASRLARLPTTNARRATTSASSARAAADLEQVLQRFHVEAGVGAVLEAGDGPVQHLLDDGAGHRLDVVDVEQADAWEFTDSGVDVARHGDVEEQEVVAVAARHGGRHELRAEDEAAGAGAADHDVGPRQGAGDV